MTSLFYTTQTCKYPTHEVAPFIQTGTKMPYNMKVYKGRATFAATGSGTAVKIYDTNTGEQIMFPENTCVIAFGLYTTSATTAGRTLAIGLSSDNATIASNLATTIPVASVDLGCGFHIGVYNAATISAVNISNSSTHQVYPMAAYSGGATTGVTEITMLCLQTQ